MQNTGVRRRRRLPQLRTVFVCLLFIYAFSLIFCEISYASGRGFTRGTVRSFVYSLDFLLFLTASLLNCGEEARFANSTARTATLIYVPVCFIILLFASSRRVLHFFSYIFILLFIFLFCL